MISSWLIYSFIHACVTTRAGIYLWNKLWMNERDACRDASVCQSPAAPSRHLLPPDAKLYFSAQSTGPIQTPCVRKQLPVAVLRQTSGVVPQCRRACCLCAVAFRPVCNWSPLRSGASGEPASKVRTWHTRTPPSRHIRSYAASRFQTWKITRAH